MRYSDSSSNGRRRLAPSLSRLGRRLAAIVEECHYAQRRMSDLRAQPDGYLFEPDVAPDTYGDFLFRTSGPAPREPSARARAAGRQIAR
jgi:hypothetical protein